MAKVNQIKPGQFYILKSDLGEVDFQVTNVTMSTTMSGGNGALTIEGYPIRQRMNETVSHLTGNTGISGYAAIPTRPNTTTFTFEPGDIKFTMEDVKITPKGMTVQIKTIETVDGHKAQIVLTVGTKNVIAWESDAFEDDADLEKGQTGEVKAKKAAESHAKDVLKRTFQ